MFLGVRFGEMGIGVVGSAGGWYETSSRFEEYPASTTFASSARVLIAIRYSADSFDPCRINGCSVSIFYGCRSVMA